MIQTTEREVINNEIVKMLNDGLLHKDIAKELGVSKGWVSTVANRNGLARKRVSTWGASGYVGIEVTGGSTLDEIRKANRFKVGDKVRLRVKTSENGKYEHRNCIVEQVTPYVVYVRDKNRLMRTAMFAEIGMDSNLIRKVG